MSWWAWQVVAATVPHVDILYCCFAFNSSPMVLVLVPHTALIPHPCRLPWGVLPAQTGPVQYTGQPTGPNGQPAPRLLFPSAQPGPSPSPQGAKPTFPAYSGASGSGEGAPEKKPQLIATTGSSSKIIHPPEDISLVIITIMMIQVFK